MRSMLCCARCCRLSLLPHVTLLGAGWVGCMAPASTGGGRHAVTRQGLRQCAEAVRSGGCAAACWPASAGCALILLMHGLLGRQSVQGVGAKGIAARAAAACRALSASNHTYISVPSEQALGAVPCWTGCWRMPRPHLLV